MGRGIHKETLALIEEAYEILHEIQPAGVRAVCYRLFVCGTIDSMEKRKTQKVSKALVYAREQGIIPWEWIVDETRSVERTPVFSNKKEFARVVKANFRRDFWDYQICRLEVWSEKGTVRGTLKPILDEYAVGFQVLHGFGSATAIKKSADSSTGDPRPLFVLYVGDWDCSGLYMSEADLPSRTKRYSGDIDFERIALTSDDLKGLPSFPASHKKKDTRYKWFLKNFGDTCWELDALSPVVLRGKVQEAIAKKIDHEAWDRCLVVEAAEQASLAMVMNNWEKLARSPEN